jgi:hypothetical protein
VAASQPLSSRRGGRVPTAGVAVEEIATVPMSMARAAKEGARRFES